MLITSALHRRLFKRFLIHKERRNPDQKTNIEKVLHDDKLFNDVIGGVNTLAVSKYGAEIAWMENFDFDESGSTEHPILAWLAAHWEEILKVILALIAQFSATPELGTAG